VNSQERDVLTYVASSLDDVRKSLDTASSAAATALAWVRIQQMRANDEDGVGDGPDLPA
jgi:hypothetical protein